MKKINKILLYPMPIIAALPTMSLITSCSDNVDFDQVKAWFEDAYAKVRDEFEASGKATDSLKIGLSQIGDVEKLFIEKKVRQYLPKTVINLRKEEYGTELYDVYYGAAYEERESIFLPLKEEKVAEGKWIATGATVLDSLPNPQGGTGNPIAYYPLMATINGYVVHKGLALLDLAGWASDLIYAAIDVREGETTLPSWTTEQLNADIDGANIGYMFLHSQNKYESPTIAMYDYYTNLTSHKLRCRFFYEKTLGLNLYWEESKKLSKLIDRLTNFYFASFLDGQTELKWDKDSLKNIKDALQIILRRIETYIKY